MLRARLCNVDLSIKYTYLPTDLGLQDRIHRTLRPHHFFAFGTTYDLEYSEAPFILTLVRFRGCGTQGTSRVETVTLPKSPRLRLRCLTTLLSLPVSDRTSDPVIDCYPLTGYLFS